ncbi:hypothetical protein ElyMa_006943700 [Elysia marginata]|uniref:Uncharacterized protein n=1 Tax=Elysia marginata TaxID=1093978 RepID=A0AAV4JH81_9GAST|nr:hypothetical protein ElyMa_006943700 [Elysia marginata]
MTQKETDFDHIEITKVYLPYHDEPIKNWSFGLVNSVREEIDRLIRRYGLQLTVDSCTLALTKICGISISMDPLLKIEDYIDDLTCEGTVVRLIHSQPLEGHREPQASMDFMGVTRR